MDALPTLDVIITCYNTNRTLAQAVTSSLEQTACRHVYIIDNASTDGAKHLAKALDKEQPRVTTIQLTEHANMAIVRNWALMNTQADLVAFLDADSTYQSNALEHVPKIFNKLPQLSSLRLCLKPVDLNDELFGHPNFVKAWDKIQLSLASNGIYRRNILLACGGFPQDEKFHQTGGEDIVLNLALQQQTLVSTLFANYPGVVYRCLDNKPAIKYLRTQLFGDFEMPYNQSDVQAIVERLQQTQLVLQDGQNGVRPINMKK